MPLHFARRLTGRNRTLQSNRILGITLAFVAGAINAGGFLAVKQYTSHMTGIVSAMADNLALGNMTLVPVGLGALLSFMLGAACSAVMVNYARRRGMHSEFALPLLLEAFLLLLFGLMGARLMGVEGLFVPVTVMLLCFMMGLQNAVISKLSNAEIRTTHVTGMVTDIGIEIGKLLYWNRHPAPAGPIVLANRQRLRILLSLVAAFFVCGVLGALGFQSVGYSSTVPLALLLLMMAGMPAVDDLRELLARLRLPH
ncbi:MAG: YoaK family protein [Burkholderiaceae bacterium]